jgi:hypothetical protein
LAAASKTWWSGPVHALLAISHPPRACARAASPPRPSRCAAAAAARAPPSARVLRARGRAVEDGLHVGQRRTRHEAGLVQPLVLAGVVGPLPAVAGRARPRAPGWACARARRARRPGEKATEPRRRPRRRRRKVWRVAGAAGAAQSDEAVACAALGLGGRHGGLRQGAARVADRAR